MKNEKYIACGIPLPMVQKNRSDPAYETSKLGEAVNMTPTVFQAEINAIGFCISLSLGKN